MTRHAPSNDNLTGYDAGAVANALLDRASARGIAVSHMALQKLVYFAHGLVLTRHCRRLVDGYFEAWEHGPVHPLLYASFKHCGKSPIEGRAMRRSWTEGSTQPAVADLDPEASKALEDVLIALGEQPAWRLRAISHSKDGPWDATVNRFGTSAPCLGLRISDTIIAERFRRHLLVVGTTEDVSDTDAESAPS